jgi:hypothetical protein
MGQSGYEIRWGILQEARSILTDQYISKQENENARAAHEDRAPALIQPPSMQEIKALADEMYEFVLRK